MILAVGAMVGLLTTAFRPASTDILVIGQSGEGCKMYAGPDLTRIDAESVFFSAAPNSNFGNAILRCKVNIPNGPGSAITLDYNNTNNTYCAVNGMISDKWHQVITPNGRSTLICHAPGY